MQKLYHSISEVSELVEEEQHILRYWEKEFEQLSPKKNRGGNRIYSEKDVLIIKAIKKFLRDDKLSLKGAKEQLDKLLTNQNGFGIPYNNGVVSLKEEPSTPDDNLFSRSAGSDNKNLNDEELNEIYDLLSDIAVYLRQ